MPGKPEEAKYLLLSEKVDYRNLQIIKRLQSLDFEHFNNTFINHMIKQAPTVNDLFVDLCNIEMEYYLMVHM